MGRAGKPVRLSAIMLHGRARMLEKWAGQGTQNAAVATPVGPGGLPIAVGQAVPGLARLVRRGPVIGRHVPMAGGDHVRGVRVTDHFTDFPLPRLPVIFDC